MRGVFAGFAILLLLVTIFSCSEDKKNPIGPGDEGFVYPMKIGNSWEYSWQIFWFNFRPDTLDVSLLSDTLSAVSLLEITGTKVFFDTTETYVFYERLTEEGYGPYEGLSYYSNQDDGLYLNAYRGSSFITPKSLPGKRIYYKKRYFRNIEEIMAFIEKPMTTGSGRSDSLYYENPPLKSIQFPLEVALQWSFRQAGNPWRIDKKVVGTEKVQVPGGSFDCYKIQWLMDTDDDEEWDEDIEYFDYISSKGVIKRSRVFKDMMLTDEKGNTLVTFDSKEEASLTDVHLK